VLSSIQKIFGNLGGRGQRWALIFILPSQSFYEALVLRNIDLLAAEDQEVLGEEHAAESPWAPPCSLICPPHLSPSSV
jgi:hypothetical protein